MSWGWFGISVRKYIDSSWFQLSGALLEQSQSSTVEWFSTWFSNYHARKILSSFSIIQRAQSENIIFKTKLSFKKCKNRGGVPASTSHYNRTNQLKIDEVTAVRENYYIIKSTLTPRRKWLIFENFSGADFKIESYIGRYF